MPYSVTKQDSPKESEAIPKPPNVFYVWYVEQCRRLGQQPLSNVKPAKPKNQTVLDFAADRIKPEEWPPIINALRLDTSLHVIAIRSRAQCKFLHDVDTEEKARHMKRRAGSLFTTYILKSVLKSVTNCIKKNDVLSSLELDGIPVTIDYIDGVFEALKKNKTIKVLAIKYCSLRDLGCQLLCNNLRQIPNIQVLNLTACGLGPLSAQYIAKVVKYQQINRYCESWHNSLRYEDPEVGIMAGLKRITLNNNPGIGDEGLIYILDELDDDLWIKAIDMQRCGITENVAPRLLDVIDYSRSLEVADFRSNDHLSPTTIDKVLEILKNKQKFGYDNEYQWCLTATTLPADGSISGNQSISTSKIPLQSKSAPLKFLNNQNSISSIPPRRMKTCISISKRSLSRYQNTNNKNMDDAKRDVLLLNDELQKEIAKRRQSEIENRKLKQELAKIRSTCALNENPMQHREKVVKFNPMPQPNARHPKAIKSKSAAPAKQPKVEFVFETKTQARNILQKIVKQNAIKDSEADDISCFKDIRENKKNTEVDDDDDGGSNASLISFLNEMKMKSDDVDISRSNIWDGGKMAQCYRKVSVH